MRKKRKYFLVVSSWLIQLLIHSLFFWTKANGKGIGVMGKGGGGEGKKKNF